MGVWQCQKGCRMRLFLQTPATLRIFRPSVESLLHRSCRASFPAFVASPDSCWAAELRAPNARAPATHDSLQQVLDGLEAWLRSPQDSQQVIGVAALASWRMPGEKAFSHNTHFLMAASASSGFKAHVNLPQFLEDGILAGAILQEFVLMPSKDTLALADLDVRQVLNDIVTEVGIDEVTSVDSLCVLAQPPPTSVILLSIGPESRRVAVPAGARRAGHAAHPRQHPQGQSHCPR